MEADHQRLVEDAARNSHKNNLHMQTRYPEIKCPDASPPRS
jgi:hypothetical protein